MTERQPFMPHAHGVRVVFIPESLRSPSGKGMPIKNAAGDIKSMDRKIFIISGRFMVSLSSGISKIIYKRIKKITSQYPYYIFPFGAKPGGSQASGSRAYQHAAQNGCRSIYGIPEIKNKLLYQYYFHKHKPQPDTAEMKHRVQLTPAFPPDDSQRQ
jgi:hypothetical protein